MQRVPDQLTLFEIPLDIWGAIICFADKDFMLKLLLLNKAFNQMAKTFLKDGLNKPHFDFFL